MEGRHLLAEFCGWYRATLHWCNGVFVNPGRVAPTSYLLPAGKTRQRLIEESARAIGLGCVNFPCKDAVAAGPGAGAAERKGWAGGGSDVVIHHVHISYEEDIWAIGGDIKLIVQQSVHKEFRVGRAWRDLPHDLDEEVTVESGEKPLAVSGRRGGILLGAYVEE